MSRLKIFLIILAFGIVGFVVYQIRKRNENQNQNKEDSSHLEAHVRDRTRAMENATCDYTLNLSESNKVLWKACQDGYDRYYIPERAWFKNNIPDQSADDKNMCIGKAITELRKENKQFFPEMNDNFEFDLWFSKKC